MVPFSPVHSTNRVHHTACFLIYRVHGISPDPASATLELFILGQGSRAASRMVLLTRVVMRPAAQPCLSLPPKDRL